MEKEIKEYIQNNAVDEAYLSDWYQQSVDSETPPVWTDEHIAEVFNDFYMIPREVVENL